MQIHVSYRDLQGFVTAPPSIIREASLSPPPSHFATSLPDIFDPNLDIDAQWLGKRKLNPSCKFRLLGRIEDDSPYPEVRSAVANYDDPSMPASTIRSWCLGVIWAIIIPGVNQFFYLRYPSIMVTGVSQSDSIGSSPILT